jgi:copper(I)-binding protein
MRKTILSAAMALIATPVLAAPALAANVTIDNPWFRALPNNLPAGGYFTLHNASQTAVTLTAASSPACGMLMLHKSESMNGMASMEDVASVPVPAGGFVAFAPGGYHLMCMKPTPAMKPGANVPVTLQFADGTRIVSAFTVKNATGR